MATRTAAERGREVRGKLLDAAAELIPELGWNAVSTRVLAERAGLTSGLIHYHFQSLQALLREAAVGVIREFASSVKPVLDTVETADAGVEMLLGSLDEYSGLDPTSLLITETYLAATRDEVLREEMAVLVADFRRDLGQWLAEHGQETPDETASVLAAAVDGVMLHRMLNPELKSATVAPVLRRLVASTNTATTINEGNVAT